VPVALGVDFGTESGRCLLVDLDDGSELADTEVRYPSGVIDEELPGTSGRPGTPLPADWALQDPRDYLHVLAVGVPETLRRANRPASDVVGIGVDVTSCTLVPTTAEGIPLSTLPDFAARPHAWTKLWKHHSAQPIADRLTALLAEAAPGLLARYGGRVSSEWYYPKLLELWLEDPATYRAAERLIEATDWIVWQLTGVEARSACPAAYKAFWSPTDGLLDPAVLAPAFPGFEGPGERLGDRFHPVGHRAGGLSSEMAVRLGLRPGTAVAVGNVDSFVAVPGLGVRTPGTMVSVVGTSVCDVLLAEEYVAVPGMTGVAFGGVLPGYYGYEAGQAAVGDMFAWFVDRLRPTGAPNRAGEPSVPLDYAVLEAEAARLRPGASGLVALDWWNGNRSTLADADLSGVIVGLGLATTAAEIYRTLMEGAAFGARRIVDAFVSAGLPLSDIVACGGIAEKSPLAMQILADVTGRAVRVPRSQQIPARGAALLGAVAAGAEAGGFASIDDALRRLPAEMARRYTPTAAHRDPYERLYALYSNLSETLGRHHAEWLHDLRSLRREVRAGAGGDRT